MQRSALNELDPPLARIGVLLAESSSGLHEAMHAYRTQILRAEWQILTECMELNCLLADSSRPMVDDPLSAEEDALLARHAVRLQQQVADLVGNWHRVWNGFNEQQGTRAVPRLINGAEA